MSVFSREEPEVLEEMQIGGEYDGSMDFEEMQRHVAEFIDFRWAEWTE
jgi:hypothetical protein